MPGFVVERHGYATASQMAKAIIADMLANGFVQKFPTVTFNPGTIGDAFRVTMEAGPNIDPLNATAVTNKQPWRVMIDVTHLQRMFMYVATPLQLNDEGSAAVELTGAAASAIDILGSVGEQIGATDLSASGVYNPTTDSALKGLVNRELRVGANGASYPLSYRLVITPRGIWLGVWEEAISTETATFFNWVLIQRPVDRTTGAVYTEGKAPLFCVNAVGGKFWQFTVRESDITRPGKRRPADSNTPDSEAILNSKNQVSLSEDGKYVVTFPSRLNSSRYRYPHELDMLGVTSADVVSQHSDVPLQFYGEQTGRVYKALHASGGNNIGMRILILMSGGGIS
jgi:hypothetical protein